MATLTLSNVYMVNASTTPPDIEMNVLDYADIDLGTVVISDGTASPTFTGADVAVSFTFNGHTEYGWITRTIKDNGETKGFYLWTDPNFTSLADAIAAHNQDPDHAIHDNSGYIICYDHDWFDALPFSDSDNLLKTVHTSSDPVGAALNGVMPEAPAVSISEDANNDGWITAAELSGNVDVLIGLPANALAGDTLNVTDGHTTQQIVLTPGQIASGQIATSFAPPAEGAAITVTSFVSSGQTGISGPSGSDAATRDSLAPAAPTVTITEDANNDGWIVASELSGNADVRIGLPSGAQAGDTLTVTDGHTTQTFTLTTTQVTAGRVDTSFAAPGQGNLLTVTAHVTDTRGNAGADGSDSARQDTQGPPAPVVTITEDTNNDGLLGAGELSGNVGVSIALPVGVVPGDVLSVTDGIATQTFTLTSGQISAGSVATEFAPPAEHGTITVTAHVTDVHGNVGADGSDAATRHSFGPPAPVVTITEDANNDGLISNAELNGYVDVAVALPAGVVAGDVLTVSDGNTSDTFTLSPAQVAAGTVSTSFVPPSQGATITVYAYVTDQLGNQGGTGSDSAARPAPTPHAPPAPVVVITEDANNDNVISGTELSGNLDVSVALPSGAAAGNVLTVTDGITVQTYTLTSAQVQAGAILTSFAPPAEHGTITVDAWLTAGGLQGDVGSDFATLHQFGPASPTVVITEDANNDGILGGSELAGNVNVTVGLPSNAATGDKLTVTDGITTQTFTLTGAQVAAGNVPTDFAPPPQGGTITVTAFVTDAQSNQGPSASDTALRDTAGPLAPQVLITEDANNDGTIAASELSGSVDTLITLPTGVVPGDVITIHGGSQTITATLTADLIQQNHGTVTFTPPAQGATLDVTAFITDTHGNAGGTGHDAAVMDTQGPPAPGVVIVEDADNDGDIDANELSGDVDVLVTLPAGAVVGDTVFVTDGTTVRSLVLTAADLAAAKGTTTFAAPAEDHTITATAWLADPLGNKGPSAQDAARMDLLQPASVYSVLLGTGDRFYSTDAHEAALMAQGAGNVFEGVRFDSLTAAQGGVQMSVWMQPFTTDWWFGGPGVEPPYACYELQPNMDGFKASMTAGTGETAYHLYLDGAGITQLLSVAEATQLNLGSLGYADLGVQFYTTANAAFAFDVEGYLVANQSDPATVALVHTLASTYTRTSDAGFVDAVEQDFLARVDLTGLPHGGAANAADVNAAFGTAFAA